MEQKVKLKTYVKANDFINQLENHSNKMGLLKMMMQKQVKREKNKINILQLAASNEGLSNIDLAEKLHKRPESISRHMNGKTQISVEDAELYGKILNIPPAILLFPPDPVKIKGYVNLGTNQQLNGEPAEVDVEIIKEERFALPPVNLPNCELLLSNEEGYKSWDKVIMLDTTPGEHYLEKLSYVKLTKKSADEHGIRQIGFYKPYKEPFGKLSLLVPFTDKVLRSVEVEEIYQIFATIDGRSHRSVWMISDDDYHKKPFDKKTSLLFKTD
jgi:hypothetical protein